MRRQAPPLPFRLAQVAPEELDGASASSPFDAFDLWPDFPEYVATRSLLRRISLEIIGVQRLADDDFRPAEPIACRALRHLLHGAQLSGQLRDFFLQQVRDVLANGIETLEPSYLVLQEFDPNIPVCAVLRAWAYRPNSHCWLLACAADISVHSRLKISEPARGKNPDRSREAMTSA
jgi:hypothetical protein